MVSFDPANAALWKERWRDERARERDVHDMFGSLIFDRDCKSRSVRAYVLANKGHDTRGLQAYLGHRNIQHTVRYSELSPDRFKHFWRE